MKIRSRNDNLLVKIFIYMVISISLTIIFISPILYINFENIALGIIHSYIKDSLYQISYSSTFMTESAKSLALQVYFDSVVAKLLYNSSPGMEAVSAAHKQLGLYRSTTPYIESIYIYNSNSDYFYASSASNNVITQNKNNFFDAEILDILSSGKGYTILKPILRRIPVNFPESANRKDYTYVYTYIFYYTHDNTQNIDNAVVLNISEKWIREMINSLDAAPGSDTFIIDKSGTVINSNNNRPMMSNIGNERYIKEILSSENPSGYIVYTDKGEKSLITYVSSDILDWKFIRITPYNNIVSRINSMKTKTFLFGLLFLIAGLLLSVVFSKQLYRPIEGIIGKLRKLEEEKKGNLYTLKQECLRNIITNPGKYSLDEIRHKLDDLKIDLNPAARIVLMALRIDNYSNFCSQYNVNDRNLMKYAIMNIATELSSAIGNNEAADLFEDGVFLLLNISDEQAAGFRKTMEQLAENIKSNVQKWLHISLSITVSPVLDSILELEDTYHEVQLASNYRLYYGHNCTIFLEDVQKYNTTEYAYPLQKEKMLINALMLGKKSEAVSIYQDIIKIATGFSYHELNMILNYLALRINTTIRTIEQSTYTPTPYNISSFISEMNKKETLEEIDRLFYDVFDYIISKIEDRKSEKYDDLVNRVTTIVNEQYMDANLSIQYIADKVDMSPVYLGRLFKKLTLKSIPDYINEVRMEKAKELLEKTELNISEIVEKVGIINISSFYTNFKKAHGLTPKEYKQGIARDKAKAPANGRL